MKSIDSNGYVRVRIPGHPRAHSNGYVLEHVVVAEAALGKPLPAHAVIHHVNRNRQDNRPSNLVICEDHAYHRLLHRRADMLEECGHADWLRCTYCHQPDAPERLSVSAQATGKVVARHPACRNEYMRDLRARRGSPDRRRKLSDEQVEEVRALCETGVHQAEVGARFGITQGHVSALVRGRKRKASSSSAEA